MSKRLAITISGAVSLGSYEAGVLYEIITAIGQHNAHKDTIAHPEEKIEIDVLTGASAGGMTAVIAAQNLLYAPESFIGPNNNPFYNPWVADISLDALLQLDAKPNPASPDLPAPEDPAKSIFSSNLIERLARKYITDRYAKGKPAKSEAHPAAAAKISLGLALSNLNGVPYSYPLRVKQPDEKESFAYTRFQDEMTGQFASAGLDKQDDVSVWTRWRDAAVSCGAFPFAFRVKELHRLKSEYTRAHLVKWETEAQDFAYTDGGIFQNEPLGLAKNLVDLIDRPKYGSAADYQNADTRFYLYVAPGAKTSDANNSFNAAQATYLPTAQAIASAVIHQAKFQDWVEAEEINDQIHIFNLRADELFGQLKSRAIDPKVLQAAADVLLPKLFATAPAPPAPRTVEDTADQAAARLRRQFARESAELKQISDEVEKAWIDSILVLETAAELNFKDEMYIYGITATNEELAGGGLFAFEGFFDLVLRQHDYNLGRAKAREFLAQHIQAGTLPATGSSSMPAQDIGPIRYHPDDDIPEIKVSARDPKTGDVLIAQLDLGVRQQLLETAGERASVIIEEVLAGLGLPSLLAAPVRWLLAPVIKSEIKKRLALS